MKINFTCPRCGCHNLHRYRYWETTERVNILAIEPESHDELVVDAGREDFHETEEVVRIQCASCEDEFKVEDGDFKAFIARGLKENWLTEEPEIMLTEET